MIRILFFLIIITFGFCLALVLILKFLFAGKNVKNRLEEDKLSLLDELYQIYNEDLVPLDKDEFKLLSMDFKEKSSNDSFGKTTKGIYQSVFHEPLVCYATKDYYGNEHYLTVVRTKSDSLVYQQEGHSTKVSKNGKAYGHIDQKGILYDLNQKKIASLESKVGEFHLIKDADKELVHLRKSKNETFGNEKAFPIVQDLNDSDRTIVLILTMFDFLVKN